MLYCPQNTTWGHLIVFPPQQFDYKISIIAKTISLSMLIVLGSFSAFSFDQPSVLRDILFNIYFLCE